MQNTLSRKPPTSHIWYPFTQPELDGNPLHISRGQGAYLYTATNTAYLDTISPWWCNLHGHVHPHIAQAIAHQAKQLEHVMFANLTHYAC